MNHDEKERTFKEMFLGALLAVVVILAIDHGGAARFEAPLGEHPAFSVITHPFHLGDEPLQQLIPPP